ncbi:MAG: hypothetical protein ABF759_13180, partial [Acetobacter malorum]
EVINKTISKMRLEILDSIDKGISDDQELKEKIRSVLESEKPVFEEKIKACIQEIVSDTQKSCQEIIDGIKIQLSQENTFSVPGFAANFNHTIEVETKSGVDWLGLGTSIAAGAAAVILTGGLGLLFALAGVLMGVINAVMSLLDSGYKKDQQRNALNRQLFLIEKEWTLSAKSKINEISYEIEKVVRLQTLPFKRLCVNYYKSGLVLLDVSENLKKQTDLESLFSVS